MPITIDGSNGITQAGEFNSDSTFGFKNRIINGAMVIDQRNAGASVSIAAGGSPFTLDRFRSDNSTDGAVTVQRVTDAPTGFVNSMKYTVTTADASLASTQYLALNHFIEGFNTADLMWGTANAKTITISFWVKSSITGNYPIAFDNNAGTRFYIEQYSISSANTWEYKTVTIAGDTSGTWLTNNERGVNVRWWLGSGTGWEGTVNSWQTGAKYTFSGAASVIGTLNATWQVTGVQLEVGSTATSFDYRPYGTELALCQRYFQRISGSDITLTVGQCDSTSGVYGAPVFFVQEMRATPTITFPAVGSSAGQASFLTATGGYPATFGTVLAQSVRTNGFTIRGLSFTSAFTAGNASGYYFAGTATITVSAEL